MSKAKFESDRRDLTTAAFLTHFFADTRHSVELRALPSKARCFTRKQNELKRFIEVHTRENLYFGCATREAGGGTKGHCRELVALWVDIDHKTTPEPQARKLLQSFPLQPSIVVESGGGLHLYWLLDVTIMAQDERVEPILRGVAVALEADPAAAEVARIMRLPGTLNYKYQAPRECRVMEADWKRRYALREFEQFGERKTEAPEQRANGSGNRIADGRRNVTLTSIAGQMRHHIGLDEAEILDALLSINARRCVPPLKNNEVEGIAKSIARYPQSVAAKGVSMSPWRFVVGMETFLEGDDEPVGFMVPRMIAKGNVTEVFSPRGLGKSLWAISAAVTLAKAGLKVLLIDRDNPRRTVRERLRAFGATSVMTTLKFLARESAPPLTNAAAWAEFPYSDYDLVIIDSLDSAAEGIGEQDSSKPSKAIAPLLDIAHRENGPAVLVLGNCVKNAAHSRGSGVIEDRSDIVFEVRDATDVHPTGKRPWIEELPVGGVGEWAARASRRKRHDKYRLAFIATKFRIAEEPDPFVLEIDLTTEPWSVRDATDDVDREGKAERERQAQEGTAAVKAAAESLAVEILRRAADGEPSLLRKQAEEFLTSLGIKQKIAREALNSPVFESVDRVGKGHPKAVRLAGENDSANRNRPPTLAAIHANSSDGDFGHPHPERATEIGPPNTQYRSGSKGAAISVDHAFSTPDGRSSDFQEVPSTSAARETLGTEEEL